MTKMDRSGQMASRNLPLFSRASAALFLRILVYTAPFTICFILLFGTAAYLDGDVPNITWLKRTTITLIGFLPWFLAAPITVLIGFRQAVLGHSWGLRAAEWVILSIAILAVMLTSMTFVMAPYWGTTIDVILDATEFRDWTWDILFFIVALLSGQILGTISRNAPPPDMGISGGKIMARSASRVDIVDIGDIIAASAQGNYVALVTQNSEFLHRTTLSKMRKQLLRHGFILVHRSHLVRANAITSVTRSDGRIKDVHLKGGRLIPVSAGNQDTLKQMFGATHIAA